MRARRRTEAFRANTRDSTRARRPIARRPLPSPPPLRPCLSTVDPSFSPLTRNRGFPTRMLEIERASASVSDPLDPDDELTRRLCA